jgi:hypothetical protein
MRSWREEYMNALDERDQRERAGYDRISEDFIDACKLPDSPLCFSF